LRGENRKAAVMNFLILTGGGNKRIGCDKAFLKVGKATLIERVLFQINKVKEREEQIILVGKIPSEKREKLAGEGLKWVEDIFPGKGPLGGIYSGLFFSTCRFNFVLGCDMPFLRWEFIDYMRHLPKNYDILIPSHSKGIEPLHAIYSRSCLPVIKEKINRGNFKIQSILPHLKVKFIKEKEIRRFSSPEYIFFNVNTRNDLNKAIEIVEKAGE